MMIRKLFFGVLALFAFLTQGWGAIAPIADYRMDECRWSGVSGEVKDSSSSHFNATAEGAVTESNTTASGGICQVGRFDGDNDYVNVGNVLNPNAKNWSVSVWFKWNGKSGDNILYNKEGLYEARVLNGYFQYAWQPHWYWDGGNSFPVTANEWTHAVVTYDGAYQRVYKNGVKVYERAQTGNVGSNTNKLLLGARGSDNPSSFFGGNIDEVQFYEEALSDAQIKEIYDNQNAKKNSDGSSRSCEACPPPAPIAPIADYRMDECRWSGVSGEVVDSSGRKHNGTIEGAPYTESNQTAGGMLCKTGYFNNADSDSQAISIPDSHDLSPHMGNSGEMTVSAWIKTDRYPKSDLQGRTPIVAKGDVDNWEYALYLYNNGKVGFSVWNPRGQGYAEPTGGSLSKDEWHHVVGVIKKGSYVRVYLDGKMVGESTSFNGYTANTNSPLYIARRGTGNHYFHGYIDEAKIFNKALSSDEINEIYNKEKDRKNYDGSSRSCEACPPPAPIADYRMDECVWNGTSDEVRDASGNNLNGTAKSGATAAFDGKICKFGYLDSKQYIEVPDNTKLRLTNSLSISAWIKTSKPSGTIVSKTDARIPWKGFVFAIGPDSGGKLAFWNGNAWTTSKGKAVNDNKWHHVAMTVSGKTLKFYVDGIQDGADLSMSQAMSAASSSPMRIGLENNPSAAGRYFSGSIDELKIWSGSLSSLEIKDIYTNESNLKNYDGTARTCNNCRTGPSLKWTFSECTLGQDIKSVKDYSGAGNDGTVTGSVKCVSYPKNTDDNKGALFTQSGGRQYVTSNKNLSFTYQSGYTVITRFKFEDTPYRSWLMYFGYTNDSTCANNGMHWLINSHPETPQCENRLPDSKTQVGAFCGPQNQFDLKRFEGTEEINVTTVYYKNYVGDNGQNPRRLRSYVNGNLANEYNLTASQSDPSSGYAPVFLAKQWGKCGRESDFKGVVDHLEIYPYSIDYDNKCLVLSSSFVPSSVGVNEESRYTLSLYNKCTVPITDVSLNLSWPSNLSLSNGPNISSGGWSSGANGGNWYGINIAAGSTETFSAKFKSGVAGEYTVIATPTQSTPTSAKLTVGTAEFKAWEKDGSYTNAKIYTKVAGQSISSTAYPIYVGDANNNDFNGTVCVRVVDSAHSSEPWYKKLLNGKSVAFDNIGSVSWASKNAWLEIKSKPNEDVECSAITSDASKSDAFAIKPDNFAASISPNPAKAGESFTLNVSNSTSGYTGDANISTATYKQSCATKSNFLTVSEPLGLSFSTAVQPQSLISKEVGDINISIKDSTWTKVDQYADCIEGSNSNTPDASGKVGCNIETNATIKVIPYDINASNTTAKPIWTYKSFRSEPKLSFKFEVNATRAALEDESAAQLLLNYSGECFAENTTVVMDAALTPNTKSLTNADDINITTQDSGVSITPSAESLSVVVPPSKFSGGKADVTLQINSEKNISTPDDVLKMSINGWTSKTDSNTYQKVGDTTTNLYFLYGKISAPNAMVDYASSATVRAYAQVYATNSSVLPSEGNWVQAPGSSTWWINRLHEDTNGFITDIFIKNNTKLDSTENISGFDLSSPAPISIMGGVAPIGITMTQDQNKDQKIYLHFAVPTYLWYGSKAYSYDPNTDCTQHPCAVVDIFGTQTNEYWFGFGDRDKRDEKAIKSVPKGKRAPKINW